MLKSRMKDVDFGYLSKVFAEKGYRVNTTEEKPNIFGVRAKDLTVDVFNDVIGIAFTNGGRQRVLLWEGTTDPGKPNLENPVNRAGCAILVPGQYKNTYVVGTHAKARRTEHTALVQTAGEVAVYRDSDKDSELDMSEDSIEWGYFGINIHRASKYRKLEEVGLYSAGCQVYADPAEFDTFLSIVQKLKGPFDYTLLREQDLGL